MSSRSRALSPQELQAFGRELDALRDEVLADVGEADAAYVRRVRAFMRYSGAAGRGLLFFGLLPPAWLAGTGLLALSKIVDNMELGHNVMHGQYDWMQDPTLHSQTFEWDNVCPADGWRRTHNLTHHTYTNVLGKDRDIGYGLLRVFPEQPWSPANLPQLLYAGGLALVFQWGVAIHDADLGPDGERRPADVARGLAPVAKKAARKLAKDYVVFPLLAGPAAPAVFLGNLTANLVRNVWAFAVIFCGHFTADVEVFPESVLEDESRGHWYVRQLRGSSNLEGGSLFHLLTGNLSHQIEHHLFPDVPARRYAEMAPRVRAICDRYGQHYNTGSFAAQLWSVVKRIATHSLPSFGGSPAPVEA
ncbi:MAG: acyl-CoA desaturase [bacterium]|nr:acyl-CoA desaturase [bacterium]